MSFNINDLKPVKVKNKNKLFKTDAIILLRNKEFVAKALAEALIEGDKEAFDEIFNGYLSVLNKKELSRRSEVPIATINRISRGENVGIFHILKVMSTVNQELAF